MGTFVTSQTTDLTSLLPDGPKVTAPGVSLRPGWTYDNVLRASETNAFADALLDLRADARAYALNVQHYGAVGDGATDDTTAIKSAMAAAAAAPGSGVYFPPGEYRVAWNNSIIVPANTLVYGDPGVSTIKALVTGAAPTTPTFPLVGAALFCTGDVNTGARYLTQTGRVGGSGATFNLTIAGGAVTVATVSAGGTGYKVGDLIYMAHGTVLTVATVTSYRGPVATVTITTAGSGWPTPPGNPVAQLSCSGQGVWDRILDPSTLGGPVIFENLCIDGDYGARAGTNAILTGSQVFKGVHIIGHSDVLVRGCRFSNFPNDGLSVFDCRRATIIDNTFEDCGWLGKAGTARNGCSNGGIYVTTNAASLNTDAWLVARNRFRCIGDVAIESHHLTGTISDNDIRDFGTLAIEGQASGYDTSSETASNNGGVIIPSDVTVTRNRVDGKRVTSSAWTNVTNPNGSSQPNLDYGLDGVSMTAGNEGHIVIQDNFIKNLIRVAINGQQGSGGRIDIVGNAVYYAGQGASGIVTSAPIIQPKGHYVRVKNNRVHGAAGAPMTSNLIYIPGQGFEVDITDNEFDYMGNGPLMAMTYFGTVAVKYIRFSRNTLHSMWGGQLFTLTSTSSANHPTIQLVEFRDNIILNAAFHVGYDTTPPFNISTSGTGKIDIRQLRFEGNVYATDQAIKLGAATAVMNINYASDAATAYVSTSRNVATGFTLYARGGSCTVPTLEVAENNH